MKHTMKKTLCIILSVLLLVPSVFSVFSFAAEVEAVSETGLSDGQLSLPVANVFVPAVQDGTISPEEYGSSTPIFVATQDNGLWAEDLNGDPLEDKIPESVSLYLSQDDGALYVGIVVKEEKHQGDYKLDVFLGFGDDTNSYTINSGIKNTYTMTEKEHPSEAAYSWLDFRISNLSSTIFDENGESEVGQRRYDNVAEFPLPRWARVATDENGQDYTTYEVELNFQDAVEGSGKTWTSTPGTGYFAFDLALYEGTEECGTLHFNVPVQEDAGSIPHVLNLGGGNAGLSSISVENASAFSPEFSTGKFEYDVLLPYGVPVSVTAVPTQDSATVTVEGVNAIGLNGEGAVTIKVSPANGTPARYYTLNISRERNVTTYKVLANELQSTLETIVSTNWAIGDAIEINVTGEVSSETEALFGLKTAFDSNGNKVPIIINGSKNTTLTISAQKVFVTNDLTLKNLTLKTEGMEFFAGSGNVTLDGVSFVNEAGSTPKVSLFADNYSADAFAGWTKDQLKAAKDAKGKISTSLTLANMTYTPAESLGIILGAVGFDGKIYEGENPAITPEDTTATLIVNNAVLSQVGARIGTAPVSLATVKVKSGTVENLFGDDNSSSGGIDIYKGSTTLSVSGGEITGSVGIRGLNRAYLSGDLTVEVSGDAIVSGIASSLAAEIEGYSYLNISGGTFSGTVQGTGANRNTVNNVSGGFFNSAFYGINSGSARRIYNNISGGIFYAGFYGGSANNCNIRGIINNISGTASIRVVFYGGSADGIVNGSITNTITPVDGIPGNYFGGSKTGTVKGNITNKFENIRANKAVYGGMGDDGTVIGNIENTFINSSFTTVVYGGNKSGDVEGNITNNIKGSSAFTFPSDSDSVTECFYGGNASDTVRGNITNNISGGEFKKSTVLGNKSGHVLGTIKNNISGGKFSTYLTMGSKSGNVNSIENTLSSNGFYRFFGGNRSSGTVLSIKNTFNSGFSASSWFFCGSEYGITGSITNVVNDGTFASTFYGGNRHDVVGTINTTVNKGNFNTTSACFVGSGNTANVSGSITNTINGGVFKGIFYGGNSNASDLTGSITNTITNGEFNGAFYGGTVDGKIFNNVVNNFEGGTFTAKVNGGNKADVVSGVITNNKGDATFNGGFADGTFSGETITPDVLAGKTALFVGDSISAGYCDENKKSWAERIAKSCGLISLKNAVSATSVSDVRKDTKGIIVDQLSFSAPFDYVILHGGVNDAWSNAAVGEMSDSFSPADFDTSTFAGGLENLIYTAIQKYGSSTVKIGYLINFKAPSCKEGKVAQMDEYVEMTKKICDKWAIQYFDMYNHDEITEELDMTSKTNTPDYIHPNEKGYDILAPFIADFIKTLIPLSQDILDEVK